MCYQTPAALEGLYSPTGLLPRLKTETTFLRLSSQGLSAGGITEEGLDPDLPRAFHGRQQVLPGEMGDRTKHSLLLSSVLPLLACPERKHHGYTEEIVVKAARKVTLPLPRASAPWTVWQLCRAAYLPPTLHKRCSPFCVVQTPLHKACKQQ